MPPRARTLDDGAAQRLVAFGVEVGVGFVEHDQERIAVERARKRDALRLAGGQRSAAFADLGLVAFGQADDQVVHAGRLGRRDHRGGIGLRSEPADVLRDGAGQQ